MPHLFVHVPFPLLPAAMNRGLCLCLLMAVLAAGALAQPMPHADPTGPRAQQAEVPLGWPWETQSSPRVARESWGWRSSHCRA